MLKHRFFAGAALLGLCGALAQEALAQSRGTGARLGSTGASTRVGRTGGAYTSAALSTMGIFTNNTPSAALEAPQPQARSREGSLTSLGQVPGFGRSGAGREIGSDASFMLPSTALGARVVNPQVARFQAARNRQAQNDMFRELSAASGHLDAMDFQRPLTVPEIPPLQVSSPMFFDLSLYATDVGLDAPVPTAYNRQFGLYPSAPLQPQRQPDAAPAPPPPSLSQRIQDSTRSEVETLQQAAVAAFKAATAATVPDRSERLARVLRMFANVTRLDTRAHLPSLLSVHAALEKDQLFQAAQHLFTALRRNPELLSQTATLPSYFGDPKLLDRQARRLALSPSEGVPLEPSDYAIMAYCAWVIGDVPRARAALERGLTRAEGRPEQYGLAALKVSLELAQQPR